MLTRILSEKRLTNTLPGSEIAFTGIGYGLEVAIPKGAKSGDSWEIEVLPFQTPHPLASTILGEDVFVSSRTEMLSAIRGNLVQCGNHDTGSYDFLDKSRANLSFRSDKVATHFNHVFIAIGHTIWWTDLDNYWNWFPAPESEADFRIMEWEKDPISALVSLNDVLYIHFPTAIYECVYVGKPTIVRILKRVTGAGSINARAAVSTKSTMFFMGLDNFYLWSPDTGLREIGQEVWKKFLQSSVNPADTWVYHDIRNSEVCWVNNDTIWAFNYSEGHWSKYSADGAVGHCTSPWHSDFTPISSGGTSSNIEPDSWRGIENLWVGCWGVARESRLQDNLENRLGMRSPYLETDELTYGDIHSYKTIDLVVLDAELKFPWSQIRVQCAGKQRVSEKSVWTNCGVWTPGDQHLDFPAIEGKALKLRFELVEDIIRADGTLTLNGGQQLDGKRLDLFDGSVILDGTQTLHAPEFYVDQSEGEKYFAEFYAWGERVNLPERLVGPDK